MLSSLFAGMLLGSVGTAVVIAVLALFGMRHHRLFSEKWSYIVWLLIGLRLCLPFSFPMGSGALERLLAQNIWVVYVWIGVAGLMLVYHFARYMKFKKDALRWSIAPVQKQTSLLADKLAAEMGIENISVHISIKVSSPVIVGFGNPVLFLPHEDYSENDLKYILRHEMIHYNRHDIWYKCFMLVVNALHWFNPLVWLMRQLAGGDLESSCDAAVVKGCPTEDRGNYGETILHTMQAPSMCRTAFSTYFYGGPQSMRIRLRRLLDTAPKRSGIVALCAVFVCTFLSGGAAALVSDQIVSSRKPLSTAATAQETSSSSQENSPSKEALSSEQEPASSKEASSSEPEPASSEEASSEPEPVPAEPAPPVFSAELLEKLNSFVPDVSSKLDVEGSIAKAFGSVQEKVVKEPGKLPDRSYFLPKLQEIIEAYHAGTVDTTMNDPSKPLLMRVPDEITDFSDLNLTSEDQFSIYRRNSTNGYSAMILLDGGAWQMHIWLDDNGPEDAYDLVVTAVSFAAA